MASAPTGPERFVALDGLRGIAALMVFAFHFPHRPGWIAGYGGLAVDFFFLLSGFVLAHAYEERLRRPGAIGAFLRDRVIRLHPLLLLSVIPGSYFILTGGSRDPYPLLTVLAAPIPFPAFWRTELPVLSLPANLASWSLLWELVLNLILALAAPFLTTRRLTLCVAALIGANVAATYTLPLPGESIYAGLRALPCFAVGVLLLRIYRSGQIDLQRWGPLAAPALFLALMLPGPFGELRSIASCFILFPLILLAAASYQPRFPALSRFAGGISYAFYILHGPIVILMRMAISPYGLPLLVQVAIEFLASLIGSWLAWRLYDEPVRAWLRRRFVKP